MTNKEIYDLLHQMDVKVAYDHFKTKIEPPFILYRDDDTDTFEADDKVYKKINRFTIDLVTEDKDVEMEERLESLLDDNHIPYEKTSDYIDDEQIYQIEYSI